MTGMKVDKALNYAVGVFVYNMVAKVWLKRKQKKTPYQGVLANKWYIYENVPRNY